MTARFLTADFSATGDSIFMILGLLESSHRGESESDISFIVFIVVTIFPKLEYLLIKIFNVDQ